MACQGFDTVYFAEQHAHTSNKQEAAVKDKQVRARNHTRKVGQQVCVCKEVNTEKYLIHSLFKGHLTRCQLTRKQEPEVSSHVLRDALQHQLFGLLRTVHAHSLTVLGKVILPSLLLQKLFSLNAFNREMTSLGVLRKA